MKTTRHIDGVSNEPIHDGLVRNHSLNLHSVSSNIGFLTSKSVELAKVMNMRDIKFMYLQETKWIGEKA